MRIRTVLALGLMLTLAGCAAKTGSDGVASATGAHSTPSATTTPANDRDAALKFAQCMREHGLTWFPDPQGGGGIQIKIPPGTDKSKVDAAMAACKQFMPNGGAPEKPDAAVLEQLRKFAQCMRDHGVTNFPDPKADGQLQLDAGKLGIGPGQPKFDAAQQACAQYQPKPPSGGPAGDGQQGVQG